MRNIFKKMMIGSILSGMVLTLSANATTNVIHVQTLGSYLNALKGLEALAGANVLRIANEIRPRNDFSFGDNDSIEEIPLEYAYVMQGHVDSGQLASYGMPGRVVDTVVKASPGDRIFITFDGSKAIMDNPLSAEPFKGWRRSGEAGANARILHSFLAPADPGIATWMHTWRNMRHSESMFQPMGWSTTQWRPASPGGFIETWKAASVPRPDIAIALRPDKAAPAQPLPNSWSGWYDRLK